LVFGTLPKICSAAGMTSYLNERQLRIFDYPRFAEPFRDQLRDNAGRLAAEAGIEIEFIRKIGDARVLDQNASINSC
jgi:hypothetical protein